MAVVCPILEASLVITVGLSAPHDGLTVITKDCISNNFPSLTLTVTLLSPIWDKFGVQSITPVEGLMAIPLGLVVKE